MSDRSSSFPPLMSDSTYGDMIDELEYSSSESQNPEPRQRAQPTKARRGRSNSTAHKLKAPQLSPDRKDSEPKVHKILQAFGFIRVLMDKQRERKGNSRRRAGSIAEKTSKRQKRLSNTIRNSISIHATQYLSEGELEKTVMRQKIQSAVSISSYPHIFKLAKWSDRNSNSRLTI
jgi:hypothetical protein